MKSNQKLPETLVERARKLPPPRPGKVISVPVELMPTYLQLHHMKSVRMLGDFLHIVRVREGRTEEG